MSVKFTYDDPRFHKFMGLTREGLRLWGSMSFATCIPILQHLPNVQGTLNKLSQVSFLNLNKV